MKTTATLLVCTALAASVALLAFAPGASAHLCGGADDCNGNECPDDGSVHYHTGDGYACWALPGDVGLGFDHPVPVLP